jgi:midasin
LLEPERSIVLAERGGESLEKMQITAHESFQIFATMNPGGDFGKKELSPALRNRFTEIWVPLVSDPHDRLAIYVDRLSQKSGSGVASSFIPYEWAARIISFSDFYSKSPISAQFSACELSLRDGLAWCDFMASCSSLPPPLLFIHGAQMTVLDRLGTAGFGQDLPPNLIHELRSSCLDHLHQLANISQDAGEGSAQITYLADGLKIGDFILNKSTSILEEPTPTIKYSFQAQTVAHNAMRIVRALQVPKAVLLEGSPGVGKTSIVEAIANLTGRQLQRINLSDQTDLLDLFGADAPVEGGMPGQFEWKDASFLDALQKGDWVLLDEMNLAPQTVLEGLNCCLDHRGTVYIPEIDRTFKRHPDFRVFAAQNPHHQGGSRKGLPRSLVDRFTVVFMKEMEKEDLLQICTEMAPTFDRSAISQMVNFNIRLAGETNSPSPFASLGSPWEFNLRDLGRWLQITSLNGQYDLQPLSPVEYLDTIYTGRFRTQADQATSLNICRQFFNASSMSRDHQDMVELPSELVIGHSRLEKPSQVSWTPPIVAPLKLPACLFNCSEALIRCLEVKWLPILTGSERSGKSSLVKLLAARKGVHLRVISLHSGTDTSDLIGGFEQSNAERKLIKIMEDICRLIESNLEKSYVCRDARACSFDMSL